MKSFKKFLAEQKAPALALAPVTKMVGSVPLDVVKGVAGALVFPLAQLKRMAARCATARELVERATAHQSAVVVHGDMTDVTEKRLKVLLAAAGSGAAIEDRAQTLMAKRTQIAIWGKTRCDKFKWEDAPAPVSRLREIYEAIVTDAIATAMHAAVGTELPDFTTAEGKERLKKLVKGWRDDANNIGKAAVALTKRNMTPEELAEIDNF